MIIFRKISKYRQNNTFKIIFLNFSRQFWRRPETDQQKLRQKQTIKILSVLIFRQNKERQIFKITSEKLE